jgi:hypothetical protein
LVLRSISACTCAASFGSGAAISNWESIVAHVLFLRFAGN